MCVHNGTMSLRLSSLSESVTVFWKHKKFCDDYFGNGCYIKFFPVNYNSVNILMIKSYVTSTLYS